MQYKPAHTLARFLTLLACVCLAVPAGAVVHDADGVAYVSWSASPTAQVVGYNIYRSTAPGGPFTRVNGAVVTDLSFPDTTVLDGQTYYYAVSAVDARGRESDLAAAASGIVIDVDAEAPIVLTEAPFDGQGLPDAEGLDYGRRVPADSGVYARLWDDGGVDVETLSVMVLAAGRPVAGTTSVHPVHADDVRDVVVRFVPAEPLPFDAEVTVGVDGSDERGNGMPTYQFRFRVETVAMHAAAEAAAPYATLRELAGGELLLSAEGVEVQYAAGETQWIALGATTALPPAPGTTRLSPIAFLDQVQYYGEPVTVRLPLSWEALNGLESFTVLRYHEDPAIGWQPATVGDGWLVSQQLVERSLGPAAAYIELRINHAAGMVIGLNI